MPISFPNASVLCQWTSHEPVLADEKPANDHLKLAQTIIKIYLTQHMLFSFNRLNYPFAPKAFGFWLFVCTSDSTVVMTDCSAVCVQSAGTVDSDLCFRDSLQNTQTHTSSHQSQGRWDIVKNILQNLSCADELCVFLCMHTFNLEI